jgi:hypothetical protein
LAKTEEKEKFVHEENRGSAFTNDKKSKDTDPDYLGTANIGGVDYRLVAWANEFQEDKVRLGIIFETEEEYQEKKAAREAANSGSSKGKAKSAGASAGSKRSAAVSRRRNY